MKHVSALAPGHRRDRCRSSGRRWHQSTLCFVTKTQQQPSVWKCHVPFPHCAFHFTVCQIQISQERFQPWLSWPSWYVAPQLLVCLLSSLLQLFQSALVFPRLCVVVFSLASRCRPRPCLVFTCVPFVCCQVTVLAACVSLLRLVVSSTSVNIVTDYYNNNVLISFSKSGGVPMQVQHHFLALLDNLLLLLFFWLPPSESTFQIVHFNYVPHIFWIFSSLL